MYLKKYLLLGSAPYVQDWFRMFGQRYLDDGHILCAMNNAWQVAPDQIKIWFRAEDYFTVPYSAPPTEHQQATWITVTRFNDVPFFFNRNVGGTMLPNVLSHLINEGISNEDRIWVAIAGADHVYKGERDWFYGKG